MKAVRMLAMASLFTVALICVTAAAQQPQVQETTQTAPNYSYGAGFYTVAQSSQAKQFELQNKSVQLSQRYAKTEKEDEKKALHKELSQVLGEQFDLHLQEQQRELDELEKQVAKLKTLLKKRKDSKESIVERRFEQLVQEADGLGWNAPHGSGAGYRNLFEWGVAPMRSEMSKTPAKK